MQGTLTIPLEQYPGYNITLIAIAGLYSTPSLRRMQKSINLCKAANPVLSYGLD